MAITLLNNVKLPETTLTNATMQLIARGESRAKSEALKSTTVVNVKRLQGVEKGMELLQDMDGQINVCRCKDKA